MLQIDARTQMQLTGDTAAAAAPPAVAIAGTLAASVSAVASSPAQQKTVQLGTVESAALSLLSNWMRPGVTILTLAACLLISRKWPLTQMGALALVSLLVARQVLTPLDLRRAPLQQDMPRLLLEWCAVFVMVMLLAASMGLLPYFARGSLLAWATATPASLALAGQLAARVAAYFNGPPRRFLVIGANEVGLELARRAGRNSAAGEFMGFFDFRGPERLPEVCHAQLRGRASAVADYVRRHSVQSIYLALPMKNEQRIEQLLHDLRDTTATVYFVPNIFAFDLVHARCVEIDGIPALSIYDTPFYGMNAFRKRVFDLTLASLALLLAWPVMFCAAVAVKLTSSGPVLFKQRRYGLNGEEILIYKFRSMTVCEDGPVIAQARRQDSRITPVGRFLRATSLDELPQLLNVLEGKMSFVGPRPHAVAHNELYRKMISGYMLRHKVRPGITGWAQVNGLRGETSTLEQMRLRVQYDLDYLRNWSLWLDVQIVLRTVFTVLKDANAY